MKFDIDKFINDHNDNVEYKEADYCKPTDRTYSHVQMYNFDGKIYYIQHTHKIFIANENEISSFESAWKLVDGYRGV